MGSTDTSRISSSSPSVSSSAVSVEMPPSAASDSGSGTSTKQGFRFLFCAAGIFVCYFFYGILQERMYVLELDICPKET